MFRDGTSETAGNDETDVLAAADPFIVGMAAVVTGVADAEETPLLDAEAVAGVVGVADSVFDAEGSADVAEGDGEDVEAEASGVGDGEASQSWTEISPMSKPSSLPSNPETRWRFARSSHRANS